MGVKKNEFIDPIIEKVCFLIDDYKKNKKFFKIAARLGIRFCGVQFDRYALYNDDDGCGGSFAVPLDHNEIDVLVALQKKRSDFEVKA